MLKIKRLFLLILSLSVFINILSPAFIVLASTNNELAGHITYRVLVRKQIISNQKILEDRYDSEISKDIERDTGIINNPWAVYRTKSDLVDGIKILASLKKEYSGGLDWSGEKALMRQAIDSENVLLQNELTRLNNNIFDTIPFSNINPEYVSTPPDLSNIGSGNLPQTKIPIVNDKGETLDSVNNNDNNQIKPKNAAERFVAGMLISLGDFLYSFLKPKGGFYAFDLDTIIFNQSEDYNLITVYKKDAQGNVLPYVDRFVQKGFISPFKIDFGDRNNNFGNMGKILTTITTSIALVAMFLILMCQGLKLMLSGSSKDKLSFKEVLSNYLLSFLLIFTFPFIITITFSILNDFTQSLMPIGGFLNITKNGEDLGSAIFYLASVGLSVYFAFVYGARALHIAMFYFAFPIMAMYLNGAKFRKNFDTYISDFLVTVLEQPFDAMIIMAYGIIFPQQNLLFKLILTAGLIPARGLIKRWMGFTTGSIAGDALGFAAITSVIGLAKGIGGGAKDFAGGVTSGANDIIHANKGLNTSRNSVFNGDSGVMSTAAPAGGMSSPFNFGSSSNMGSSMNFNPMTGYNKAYDTGCGPTESWQTKGGIDIDKFGKVMPQTPEEAAAELRSRGISKIRSSSSKALSSLSGLAAGSVLGAGFGVQGSVIGGNLGYNIGSDLADVSAEFSKINLKDIINDGNISNGYSEPINQPDESSSTMPIVRDSGSVPTVNMQNGNYNSNNEIDLSTVQGSNSRSNRVKSQNTQSDGIIYAPGEVPKQTLTVEGKLDILNNYSSLSSDEQQNFLNTASTLYDENLRFTEEQAHIYAFSEALKLKNIGVSNEGLILAEDEYFQNFKNENLLNGIADDLKISLPNERHVEVDNAISKINEKAKVELQQRIDFIKRNYTNRNDTSARASELS